MARESTRGRLDRNYVAAGSPEMDLVRESLRRNLFHLGNSRRATFDPRLHAVVSTAYNLKSGGEKFAVLADEISTGRN